MVQVSEAARRGWQAVGVVGIVALTLLSAAAQAEAVSVAPSPNPVGSGGTVNVAWTASATHSTFERIVFAVQTADANTFRTYVLVPAGASGTVSLLVPSDCLGSGYEVRYLSASKDATTGYYVILARASVSVVADPTLYGVTPSPNPVGSGGTLNVAWKAPSNHNALERIVFTTQSADANTFSTTLYVPAGATGTASLLVPSNSLGSGYEVRYLSNAKDTTGFYRILAKSPPVSVIADPTLYNVTPTPNPIGSGGTLNVAWKAPSNHNQSEWIVFTTQSADANTFRTYVLVPAGASGTVSLLVPSDCLGSGYEVRYLSNAKDTTGFYRILAKAPASVIADPTLYGVTPSPNPVGSGGTLNVAWIAPANHNTFEKIVLTAQSATPNTYSAFVTVPAGASGTKSFLVPRAFQTLEIRYLSNAQDATGNYRILARAPFNVTINPADLLAINDTYAEDVRTVRVSFELKTQARLRLKIDNSAGQNVAEITSFQSSLGTTCSLSLCPAGIYTATWSKKGFNSLPVSPGVYTYKIWAWDSTGHGSTDTTYPLISRNFNLNRQLPRPSPEMINTYGAWQSRPLVWRPSTGTFHNLSNIPEPQVAIGQPGDLPVPADYDGDYKTDLAVWRPSNGTWYVRKASDGSLSSYVLGQPGDRPVPGDYDGDRKTDLAVWRPSTGTWYILNSSNGSRPVYVLGQLGDIPVPGDYDGDEKADLAVWRPSNATWYVIQSSNGSRPTYVFGQSADIPVPGDYDGDVKTDPAVWRPSNGKWFILKSSDGTWSSYDLGEPSDVPVPGDYNGDGKFDIAVWWKSTGGWYVQATGFDLLGPVYTTGHLGDIPISSRSGHLVGTTGGGDVYIAIHNQFLAGASSGKDFTLQVCGQSPRTYDGSTSRLYIYHITGNILPAGPCTLTITKFPSNPSFQIHTTISTNWEPQQEYTGGPYQFWVRSAATTRIDIYFMPVGTTYSRIIMYLRKGQDGKLKETLEYPEGTSEKAKRQLYRARQIPSNGWLHNAPLSRPTPWWVRLGMRLERFFIPIAEGQVSITVGRRLPKAPGFGTDTTGFCVPFKKIDEVMKESTAWYSDLTRGRINFDNVFIDVGPPPDFTEGNDGGPGPAPSPQGPNQLVSSPSAPAAPDPTFWFPVEGRYLGSYEAGRTTLSVYSNPSEPYDTVAWARIVVNERVIIPEPKRTLLHEMGHLLGLGHSSDPSSVMSDNLLNNGMSYTQDMEDALKTLYPSGLQP